MSNRRIIKVGDVVPVNGYQVIKVFNKCSNIYYGVVIGFTINNNPRAYTLFFKQVLPGSLDKQMLMRSSVIVPQAIAINKEDLFSHGGNYEKNYNMILKRVNYEKNKTLQPRKEKEIDLSF